MSTIPPKLKSNPSSFSLTPSNPSMPAIHPIKSLTRLRGAAIKKSNKPVTAPFKPANILSAIEPSFSVKPAIAPLKVSNILRSTVKGKNTLLTTAATLAAVAVIVLNMLPKKLSFFPNPLKKFPIFLKKSFILVMPLERPLFPLNENNPLTLPKKFVKIFANLFGTPINIRLSALAQPLTIPPIVPSIAPSITAIAPAPPVFALSGDASVGVGVVSVSTVCGSGVACKTSSLLSDIDAAIAVVASAVSFVASLISSRTS